jgi:hypothetical protein
MPSELGGTLGDLAQAPFWLIVRGLGLFIQAVQTLSVSVVSKPQMARATSLRNSTTTVFSAVGVAVLTSYLTQQATIHIKDATTICLAQAGQNLQLAALHACIGQQSLTLRMNDIFFFSLIAGAFCAVAAIFVVRDPALQAAKEARKRGEKGEESAQMTVTP